MALLNFGEIFGYAVDDHSEQVLVARRKKTCPFQNAPCTKAGRKDPLGICSLADTERAVCICPSRFLEGHRMFQDAGSLAFGSSSPGISVSREIRILKAGPDSNKRIGKVDYVIGRLDDMGKCTDFAALEVQSVYITGTSVRPAFQRFLKDGVIAPDSARRPDARSSAQKRLMPQLSLKVPVFRRWGKKFFVAVDQWFFEQLPPFAETDSIDNSEVTWLVYPFGRPGPARSYSMGVPRVVYSHWSAVEEALREGVAPRPDEILEILNQDKKRVVLENEIDIPR